MAQELATADQHRSLVARFGARYGVEPNKLLSTLKATVFKPQKQGQEITNEQMMALLVVADQHKLNPFTREIYAFADKQGGIVPVVGIDGWSRIVNEHPQYDGVDFEYESGGEWVEARIFRHDRSHPTIIREFYSECSRNTDPWNKSPRRMLRHRAFMQCARLAFGFSGIYSEDEARGFTIDGVVTDEDWVKSEDHKRKELNEMIERQGNEQEDLATDNEVDDTASSTTTQEENEDGQASAPMGSGGWDDVRQ